MRYRGGMDSTTNRLSGPEAAAALELLRGAAFAYLAMVEPRGPYVLPLSFAYVDGDRDGGGATSPSADTAATTAGGAAAGLLAGRIYFHTGEGRKTAALAADPRVCLAVTAGVAFQQGDSPCADSFSYRSLLLWGQAGRIDDPARREAALRAIVAKYDAGAATKPFGEADFAQTILYEMTIEAASYKQEPAG
jgi:nitroimidazol reductase NimA-like FMN-containing flavoprotein (pyridoxamine 5'-phosphate oxidase superfamily)